MIPRTAAKWQFADEPWRPTEELLMRGEAMANPVARELAYRLRAACDIGRVSPAAVDDALGLSAYVAWAALCIARIGAREGA